MVPDVARPAAADATDATTVPLFRTSSVADAASVRDHSTNTSVPAGTLSPRKKVVLSAKSSVIPLMAR